MRVEIRMVGTPEDVETLLTALQAHPQYIVYWVSRAYPSRKQPGKIMRYATIAGTDAEGTKRPTQNAGSNKERNRD